MTCTCIQRACISSGGQGPVLGHLKDKPFDVLVDPIGEESEDQSYTVLGPVGTYAHICKE